MIWWTLGIFLLDLFVSFAWARCIKAVADNQSLMAGIWSGILSLAGAVTVISYTHNNWLLIPAVIGSAIGTYISVKFKKDDNKEQL